MGARKIGWLVAALLSSLWSGEARLRTVGLEKAKALYDARRGLFIDARPFGRYMEGTIAGALNVPVKRFKRMSRWMPVRKDAPLLIFCDGPKCDASSALARRLAKAGYTELMVYPGGYLEWKRHKLPIMGAPRPCRCGEDYRPTAKALKIDGVTLYPDPEESSQVDARWIGPLLEKGAIPRGMHLIDVRPASQYARGHLPHAVNLPFDPERMKLEYTRLPKKGPILFTCKHGSISTDAWFSLPEKLQERVFILNAEVQCGESNCTVRPN
ncbi:rhodanese-like domain-containing protein [Nitratifractor sp.]